MSKFDQLPYGAYIAGRDFVIFDRRYRPIVRVSPATFVCHGSGGVPMSVPLGSPKVTACRPDEWIEHDSKVWFYTDANRPSRDRGTLAKLEHLVASLPELGVEISRRSKTKVLA